ncbi:MAG: hypothetical protein V3R57_04775 [Candidatus Bathyarchaeia archaeon]
MALKIIDENELKKYEEAYKQLDKLGKLSPYVKKVLIDEYGLSLSENDNEGDSIITKEG